MRGPPSRRLRAVNALFRAVAKPRLARTPTPAVAREEFERMAPWLFRRPPYLLRLSDGRMPALHWVRSGRVGGRPMILYIHGGAYFAGSPATHEGIAGRLSRLTGLWVAMPAYRLAPEHPAPAALEDVRAAHARLRGQGLAGGDIVLAGDSAGGGLALALAADLCAAGDPPAGVVAFSPWVDMTLSGASVRTNASADPLLPVSRAREVVDYVRGDLSPEDPRLSPLFARFDPPPPAMLTVGDTEILRDDAVRMADVLRRAGGTVHLSERAQAPHAWPLFDGWFPEARATLQEAAAFIRGLP